MYGVLKMGRLCIRAVGGASVLQDGRVAGDSEPYGCGYRGPWPKVEGWGGRCAGREKEEMKEGMQMATELGTPGTHPALWGQGLVSLGHQLRSVSPRNNFFGSFVGFRAAQLGHVRWLTF